MTDLLHARLIVSRAALLSEREAARLIGGRGALDWLRSHVRYRWVAGRQRVLWGDVLDAAPPEGEATEEQAPKRRSRVRLAKL